MLGRLFSHLYEDLIRGLSGPLGHRLRRAWYRRRLAACGTGLVIEPGVHILGAAHIRLGDNVWLDRSAVLIAGPVREDARIVAGARSDGGLVLGDDCHIGIGTVIQAHGGISIGDCFTTSAGVKIYSLSNDPATCHAGTTEFGRNDPGYRVTPVRIGRNVWLGLDVLVLGGRIGDDCFARPQAVINGDIAPGQVVTGTPATARRPRFEQASA